VPVAVVKEAGEMAVVPTGLEEVEMVEAAWVVAVMVEGAAAEERVAGKAVAGVAVLAEKKVVVMVVEV
jgi:hypothetical protein